ncbi:MAG: ankyrin repeat domain-containing protein [Terriglobia bacterium]
MAVKGKRPRCWWMIALLSVASLAAPSGDLRLVEAVEKGDKEAVRSLLREHADVNAPQADGATALHWAAHRDDLETAELLIRAGANVNAANDYGVTALSLASTNGNAAMVEKLLKAGADPNASRPTGETVLMTAARTGNAEAVKLLLAHGAEVNAKEARREQTALMWAVEGKKPEAARALIEHGADVHARSEGGFTPLLFAARQGDVDSARILLAAGANVNDSTPEYGSALVVASASGREAVAAFLLEKGADPNAADGYGMTALHYAFQKGLAVLGGVKPLPIVSFMFRPHMQELVKTLLAHGAKPNVQITKEPPELPMTGSGPGSLVGATPFLLATAADDDVSVLRVLAAGGADPLLATKEGITPLLVAAGIGRRRGRTVEEERNALEAVELLMELGADVNAAMPNGWTPLHAAALSASSTVIQFLADNGAKLDAEDGAGQTPLSIAGGVKVAGADAGFVTTKDGLKVIRPTVVHPAAVDLIQKLLSGDATPPTAPAGRLDVVQ